MKHLTIIVPEGQHNLSSIIGSYKIFKKANDHCLEQGRRAVFKIELAGQARKVDFHDGLFTVTPHKSLASIRKTDLIIIPALNYRFKDTIAGSKALKEWLKVQRGLGAEIASICTGAFLLASTGMLDGKSCSTHWKVEDIFHTMFPTVNLQPGKLITDENGIYTNGGAFSFLNLLIYIIEKYYGRDTAVYCAKIFQIDINRNSQSPFTIFSAQRSHQDKLVLRAQDILEGTNGEKQVISSIAKQLAISRRNFDRRFLKATGYTPVEYSQRVKVEMAKKAFESTQKSIAEVMYQVGYSDSKAFREVFRRITGLSPLEYKNRYNVEFA
jgi:transcriptional regulator GlxA family with amidase domain